MTTTQITRPKALHIILWVAQVILAGMCGRVCVDDEVFGQSGLLFGGSGSLAELRLLALV
jgi:hypothetical protein